MILARNQNFVKVGIIISFSIEIPLKMAYNSFLSVYGSCQWLGTTNFIDNGGNNGVGYHFLGMSDELGFIFIEIRRQVNKFLNLTNVYNINHLY